MAFYNKSYNEKRDFFRMMVKANIEFKVEGDDSLQTGTTEDLSATGILFATSCHLKVGQTIQVKILPDGNQTVPLSADVEIIRVDVDESGKFIAAGNMSNVK